MEGAAGNMWKAWQKTPGCSRKYVEGMAEGAGMQLEVSGRHGRRRRNAAGSIRKAWQKAPDAAASIWKV